MCPNEHPSRLAVLGPPFGRNKKEEVKVARRDVDGEKRVRGDVPGKEFPEHSLSGCGCRNPPSKITLISERRLLTKDLSTSPSSSHVSSVYAPHNFFARINFILDASPV